MFSRKWYLTLIWKQITGVFPTIRQKVLPHLFVWPMVEEEFSKLADVFRFLLQVFPLLRLRKIKIRRRIFIFCGGEFFSTSENSCHSLHECCNSLIFKPSPCNDKQKCHVTDATFASSDISDMRKTSTLHGGVLTFNGL